jgi:hypothetical protein
MSQSRRSVDIRALREGREFIKATAFLLPHRAKLRVLEAMQELRLERMDRGPRAHARRTPYPPEMTDQEAVREINWRVETLPPKDTEAVVQLISRLTRWRFERRRGIGRAWRSGDRSRPGSSPL